CFAERSPRFTPRTVFQATSEGRQIELGQQPAFLSRPVVTGAVPAQGPNLQGVLAPKPDFRHREASINLQLVETAAGQNDFEHQVWKLVLFAKAPRFIRLSARFFEDSYRRLAMRKGFDASFVEIIA